MSRLLTLLILISSIAVWSQAPPKPDASPNARFGFSYKAPFGWVDRTAQMQGDSGDSSKSQVLLATFERPPQVTSDSVNSAVIIAAESVSSYPGLKAAADYFGPLTELTTSKGFTVVNRPYLFNVGTRQLPRADYKKPRGQLTMYQSSLAMLSKGYVVSFTFIGGSEEEVDRLIETLKFAPARASR
ncbi:MAG TPA: hypothetical protein VH088_22605 [Terriglobales bacterium]|jgi:hypothetical protein|nr:hypothetical protein [Terriglobales bacterium]